MKSRKALTLLELTVTFAIIAILAAIAVVHYTGTINNEAANTAELSLSVLTTGAQSLAFEQGLSTPTASDYATTLSAASPTSLSYVPETDAAATNPETVLEGSTVATSPGQVAVDASTSETGVAMVTSDGGCVMELVSVSRVQPFVPASSVPCSAATALGGPNQ